MILIVRLKKLKPAGRLVSAIPKPAFTRRPNQGVLSGSLLGGVVVTIIILVMSPVAFMFVKVANVDGDREDQKPMVLGLRHAKCLEQQFKLPVNLL